MNEEQIIDGPGWYEMRNGDRVRIHTIKGLNPDRPAVGELADDYLLFTWALDGAFELSEDGGPHESDIVRKAPEKQKMKTWFNVYGGISHVAVGYEAKEEANECAGRGRIACIQREIEFEEGEGLEEE